MYSPLLQQLINSLRSLPGVGPKSAQRMALYLLTRERHKAQTLAENLVRATEKIGYCQWCNNLSEVECCALCQDVRREHHLLCIVESPVDVYTLEQTACYRGLYYVLHGHLSPLDGIGPQELSIEKLVARLKEGTFQEVICATNPTIEGEATAHYIVDRVKPLGIKVSRLAHGVPFGGEIEYLDGNTLMRAFKSRETLAQNEFNEF